MLLDNYVKPCPMKNNTVVSDNDVRNLERNVYVLHLDFFCSMYIYVYTYAYIYIYIHALLYIISKDCHLLNYGIIIKCVTV